MTTAAGCAGGGGGGACVYLDLVSGARSLLDDDELAGAVTATSLKPSQPTFLGQSQVCSS